MFPWPNSIRPNRVVLLDIDTLTRGENRKTEPRRLETKLSCRTRNVPKKCGAYGELFFFLFKKELVVVKASLSNCDFSSGFWRHVEGCPKVLTGATTTVDGTGSECTSSFEVYEHNVESLALEVIAQKWSGEMVARCCPRRRSGQSFTKASAHWSVPGKTTPVD